MGLLLGVVVLPANFSDDFGARHLLKRIPFVVRWALFMFDGGYDKPPFIAWCEQLFGVLVQITRRSEKGFQVLPKRWVVERTFGWLNYARRLSKDYEQRPAMSESMIYLAMIHLMLKRLHPT
jgi:putative transposase